MLPGKVIESLSYAFKECCLYGLLLSVAVAAQVGVRAESFRPGERVLLFGDLHVHTAVSLDSFLVGNFNGPEQAFRFARGEAITVPGSGPRQLAPPLDFVAVTDHAEGMGALAVCSDPSQAVFFDELCGRLRNRDYSLFQELLTGTLKRNPPRRNESLCGEGGDRCHDAMQTVWHALVQTANRFNRPGEFTTLIGYEFSQPLGEWGQLHRNVIFRNERVPDAIKSAYDLPSADALFAWLARACTGDCDVLTIPHNTNFSQGVAFSGVRETGEPFTDDQLRLRRRYDRLVEVFQIKGGSECLATPGIGDEECGFEQYFKACDDPNDYTCAQPGSFVRTGLLRGLTLDRETGINPYRYGLIGSTDTHNGNPGETTEADWRGHDGRFSDTPAQRIAYPYPLGRGVVTNPGGLAAVWAEDNTRAAVFDALRRREAYATSGTRISVQFFAQLGAVDGHAGAIPMGSVIESADGHGETLQFTAVAIRDPHSAWLEKLQLVKGWEADGVLREAVYDIACASGAPDEANRCPELAVHVPENCAVAEQGAEHLSVRWRDPAFDPSQDAFYYLRVLEVPTCRWSRRQALANGLSIDPKAPVVDTIRERAWTSPIWVKAVTAAGR